MIMGSNEKNSADSLSAHTYQTLKQRIVARQLKPGVKLDIAALEAELGVSRMPILDALTRLEHDGLVTIRNRVGTYVTPLNVEMFEEIYDARIMIEQWVTPQIIMHISNRNIADFQALLGHAQQLLENVTNEAFDYLEFTRIDEQFHLELIRLSKNRRITNWYATLNTHIQTARAYSLRALERSREGQEEHECILAAFAARDVEGARQAQLLHAERSRQGILRLLEIHGEI
jgi:DNA-binding GntR family transcriptional regulator